MKHLITCEFGAVIMLVLIIIGVLHAGNASPTGTGGRRSTSNVTSNDFSAVQCRKGVEYLLDIMNMPPITESVDCKKLLPNVPSRELVCKWEMLEVRSYGPNELQYNQVQTKIIFSCSTKRRCLDTGELGEKVCRDLACFHRTVYCCSSRKDCNKHGYKKFVRNSPYF